MNKPELLAFARGRVNEIRARTVELKGQSFPEFCREIATVEALDAILAALEDDEQAVPVWQNGRVRMLHDSHKAVPHG